jgi:hypothetical protein
MRRDFSKRDWRRSSQATRFRKSKPQVIAMTGSKPVLAIASVGASLVPETVRLVVGVLANRLDPLAAMAAPPLLINYQPEKPGRTSLPSRNLCRKGPTMRSSFNISGLRGSIPSRSRSRRPTHSKEPRCWERSIRRAMYGEVLRLPASTALPLPTDPIASNAANKQRDSLDVEGGQPS